MNLTVSPKLPLSLMAKPIGSICNLSCTYCYYLEKEKFWPGLVSENQMSEKLLETYIVQMICSSPDPVVNFAWHGGEPLLRGIDFFRRVIALQQKHGGGRTIGNSLQTNGTMLTDEWCRFFTDHSFLVGLSIDGPEHCHDHYRVDRSGRGSFTKCMNGLDLLVKHKTEFNTLTVVNDYNSQFPEEVYRFLKNIGSRYMQFLPVVEWVDPEAKHGRPRILPATSAIKGEITDWTVDAVDYGNFLIRIFDEWVRHDVGDYFVLTFDCVLENRMGVPPSVCVAARTCGNAGVVEHNGDVFACDHFVFPEYKLGNLQEKSMMTMMDSPFQRQFGQNKYDSLPGYCHRCEFLNVCNGECPKNRIIRTPEGEPGLNYLCAGFKMFYRHTKPYFDFMANELHHKRLPANVKQWAQKRMDLTSAG